MHSLLSTVKFKGLHPNRWILFTCVIDRNGNFHMDDSIYTCIVVMTILTNVCNAHHACAMNSPLSTSGTGMLSSGNGMLSFCTCVLYSCTGIPWTALVGGDWTALVDGGWTALIGLLSAWRLVNSCIWCWLYFVFSQGSLSSFFSVGSRPCVSS